MHSKFSIERKVVFIVALFVLISMLMGGIIFGCGHVFDGVRTYVRGEGLWAKAQKDAVFYLNSYSYSRSESDYRNYLEALKVISGDTQARLALLASPPDYEMARVGFLQGQNHPDDIQAMINFFVLFQRISYMRDAITTWEAGDRAINALSLVGEQIQRVLESSPPQDEKIPELRESLRNLNVQLMQLENRFSLTLGEGARWIKRTIWYLTQVTLLVFIGIGLMVSRQIIKGISGTEKRLRTSESRFRRLKESNTIGIISWHMDGTIGEANDLFLNMLGYRQADLRTGRLNWRELTPPESKQRDQRAIEELLAYGRCQPFEKALIHKQGHSVPVQVGAAMLSEDNECVIAYVVDLSERKKAEQQLKLTATVFSASSDGILITDASLRIVSVNQALCAMSGYDEQDLLGNLPSIFKSGYSSRDDYEQMWAALNTEGQWQGELLDRKKNGELMPVRISINQIKNYNDQLTNYVAILSDISERKAKEEQLRHIAYHDPLTGLANRVLFDDRLTHAIKLAVRNRSKFALLYLDLDKFKPVNDLYGHKTGDALLQQVANRLTQCVRDSDTVTRLGGDEFAVLLEGTGNFTRAEKTLQHIVDVVAKPYHIDGHCIEIAVSAGLSVYPDHGVDAKTLLHHADSAMYHAKGVKQDSAYSVSD